MLSLAFGKFNCRIYKVSVGHWTGVKMGRGLSCVWGCCCARGRAKSFGMKDGEGRERESNNEGTDGVGGDRVR